MYDIIGNIYIELQFNMHLDRACQHQSEGPQSNPHSHSHGDFHSQNPPPLPGTHTQVDKSTDIFQVCWYNCEYILHCYHLHIH